MAPHTRNTPYSHRAWPALLATWAIALSWCAFLPLLGKPYSFDDLAVLAAVANWREGVLDLPVFLFGPHNEHVIPALRLVVAASTSIFGSDATVLHVLLAVTHGIGGWTVGRLVERCGGSTPAAFATTTLY